VVTPTTAPVYVDPDPFTPAPPPGSFTPPSDSMPFFPVPQDPDVTAPAAPGTPFEPPPYVPPPPRTRQPLLPGFPR